MRQSTSPPFATSDSKMRMELASLSTVVTASTVWVVLSSVLSWICSNTGVLSWF
ncbi:hypothetical protein PC116_g17800 [Phytophthora cactorum]|uniref:Uncharacterized protein n=1 Tax=Phytophthora cactorum TaxID=29920 RepID=A0A8T1CE61_9STRA|nr:hypothetical protein Pcac1_g11539 [Phytophthora cactorum]KAG2891319.1 hypothetical protein PC114_g17054 [Phytophthora cactorum]KAG2920849.1 hypothetical protein PC117_g16399 [Phytophthora cactorum]KAG2997841.1 hypothetical protein PC119_g17580 [Phytophthora cactorum]KAG3015713.1 hypothetical protein PC120_g11997 [Phytophthora cactorum]